MNASRHTNSTLGEFPVQAISLVPEGFLHALPYYALQSHQPLVFQIRRATGSAARPCGASQQAQPSCDGAGAVQVQLVTNVTEHAYISDAYYCICLSCSNKLSDLPDELAELQHLRVLRVKYNMLTKLPEVLVKMSKLEVLELSGNQITTVDDKVLAGLINVRYPSYCSSAAPSVTEFETSAASL